MTCGCREDTIQLMKWEFPFCGRELGPEAHSEDMTTLISAATLSLLFRAIQLELIATLMIITTTTAGSRRAQWFSSAYLGAEQRVGSLIPPPCLLQQEPAWVAWGKLHILIVIVCLSSQCWPMVTIPRVSRVQSI